MNKKTIYITVFIIIVMGIFVFKQFAGKPAADEVIQPQDQPQTVETFAQVFAHKLPVLTELGADWCQPCKQMQPILHKLRTDYSGKLVVDLVNVDMETDKTNSYGKYVQLRVIPVQLLIAADGRLLWKHEGFIAEAELRQIIANKTGVR
ncbi:MAG: thioredoxin family protein [Negativicutes bacterium]|jgi:thioredoxin-like negative regulator of GroEL